MQLRGLHGNPLLILSINEDSEYKDKIKTAAEETVSALRELPHLISKEPVPAYQQFAFFLFFNPG